LKTNRIEITRPFFPPREELDEYIDQIYKNQWLTNDGPLVKRLEQKLKNYLELDNLSLVSSGTMALQIVLEMLPEKGEVITTPFSFIATSSAIQWQGHTPIYADIDKNTFNIDPEKIIPLINKSTKAILATHVFGNPCDIDRLEEIAIEYNIPLIFDAAHCFGVKYKERSILSYGDFSCISFHATKVFHTVEGGAVVCNTKNDKEIRLRRNFGFNGPYTFDAIGINGKMSEIHAAMGLANLKYVDKILVKYKSIYKLYNDEILKNGFQFQKITSYTDYNYAYLPVLLKDEEFVLKTINHLNDQLIFPRRYFYPSLSILSDSLTIICKESEDVSKRVLCLPLYYSLDKIELSSIINTILDS
jgi:dTDP-4-amino-4,6-dideoxygalactose transaminase